MCERCDGIRERSFIQGTDEVTEKLVLAHKIYRDQRGRYLAIEQWLAASARQ